MKKLPTFAVTTVLAAAALAGCSTSGQQGGAEAPPTLGANGVYTTDAAAGAVDSVTWGYYAQLRNLDPAQSTSFTANQITSNICQALLSQNSDFSIGEGMASYSSTDEVTWVYKLKPGVKFTNGNPVTADDVAYSIKRNMDPKVSRYARFLTSIESVTVTDTTTVTVKLKEADARVNATLASQGGAVIEKAFADTAGAAFGSPATGVSCVGPYEVKSWTAGGDLVLTPSQHYWDSSKAPKVKTFTIRGVQSGTAQVNGLKTGDLQGMYDVPVEGISQLKSAPGKVVVGVGAQQLIFVPTRAEGPMANPKLREALSLALDRTAMAEKILGGYANPATGFINSNLVAGTDSAEAAKVHGSSPLIPVTADIDKAKELVKESGYTGTPIQFVYTSGVSAVIGQEAIYLQQAASSVGIKIELNDVAPQAFGALAQDAAARSKYDLTFSLRGSSLDILSAVLPGNPDNWVAYDNPSVTENIKQFNATSDKTKRADLIAQAESGMATDMPFIPVLDLPNLLFLGKGLTGVPASAVHTTTPWAAMLGAAQ